MMSVKISRSFKVTLLIPLVAIAANFMGATLVLADQPYERTYFENEWAGIDNLIPIGFDNSNAIYGSVMPNRDMSTQETKINGVDTGAGAVGTRALGIYGTSAASGDRPEDHRARKLALYCFLQNKYGLTGGSRHAECIGWVPTPNRATTDWERMGAALIAHQMLGKNWGSTPPRNVTAAEWTSLYDRLVNNSALRMDRNNHPNSYNSAGVRVWADGELQYDAVRWRYSGGTKDSWVFRLDGGEAVYALEIICANPLGDLSGLPEYYSLTPSMTATRGNMSVVNPGDAPVVFTPSVQHQGTRASNNTTWQTHRLIYNSETTLSSADRAGNDRGEPCAAFSNVGRLECFKVRDQGNRIFQINPNPVVHDNPPAYTVTSSLAPGTKVCYVTSVRRPTQAASPEWRNSAMRCIIVGEAPSNLFELEPEVDTGANEGEAFAPGDSVTVRNRVRNTGADSSPQTIWTLTVLEYGPNAEFDANTRGKRDGSSIADDACASFMSAGRLECNEVQRLSDAVFGPGQTREFDPRYVHVIPDNKPVGTRICFVASVNRPRPSSSPAWGHSEMKCVVVGKKPKVQVWGGDVRSGGRIRTSTSASVSEGRVFGSWGEYAALSVGSNVGFSSGAALNNGNPNPGQLFWSGLTFANIAGADTPVECAFGCFSTLSFTGASSMASRFVGNTQDVLSGNVNLNTLAGGMSTVYKAGDIRLAGTTISAGKTIIIESTGTVYIEGNITYQETNYTSIRDIPQVIIRAPTINIHGNVTQVDAWLLAAPQASSQTGVIDTCYNHSLAAGLSVGDCNLRLLVNGPVVADRIILKRTGGSEPTDGARGEPAEIFNLRADAYMWSSAFQLRNGQVQTVYSRELAPRF